MRDEARIDKFCDELKELWHLVPDWRFGQLLSNVLGSYDGDIFFPEEDELMAFMRSWFEQHGVS